MKLYLVRHADSTPGFDDNARTLSEKGKQDMRNMAAFIEPLKLDVAHFYHTQKVRTKETAAILAPVLKLECPPQVSEKLEPESSLAPLLDDLNSWQDNAMLISHNPFVSSLFAKLIADNEIKDKIAFKPGSMVCLERTGYESWILRWMLTPQLLEGYANRIKGR